MARVLLNVKLFHGKQISRVSSEQIESGEKKPKRKCHTSINTVSDGFRLQVSTIVLRGNYKVLNTVRSRDRQVLVEVQRNVCGHFIGAHFIRAVTNKQKPKTNKDILEYLRI